MRSWTDPIRSDLDPESDSDREIEKRDSPSPSSRSAPMPDGWQPQRADWDAELALWIRRERPQGNRNRNGQRSTWDLEPLTGPRLVPDSVPSGEWATQSDDDPTRFLVFVGKRWDGDERASELEPVLRETVICGRRVLELGPRPEGGDA
jgi:hypothetical protein